VLEFIALNRNVSHIFTEEELRLAPERR